MAKSLDVSLFFEDRPYKLGETIEATVQLNASREVKVRKGRVDLVYDVSWTATDTDSQPPRKMQPSPGEKT